MMIRRTGIALALALVAAAPAGAAWSPPQRLGPGGAAALATDGHGNRAIAWAGNGAVHVAFARRGGPFRGARAIPGSQIHAGQSDHQVSIAMRGGRVLVAWTFFDNSQPSTREHSDMGCCSARKAAIVDHGVPHRAATLTTATFPEDLNPAGLALGPNGRAAVATDTSGANVATLSRGNRWRRDELPNGPARPVGVYFRRGREVVTFVDADGLRDAVRIGPDHFRTGRLRYRTLAALVATNARGQQALAVAKPGGTLVGGLREPGGSFRIRTLGGSPLFQRSGLAIADSGRALAVFTAGGRLAAATGRPRAGFSTTRLGPLASVSEPAGAAVRADGRGLFLYSLVTAQGPEPLDAAFVSPSGRIRAMSRVAPDGAPDVAASAIDTAGAVVAWPSDGSLLVSRSAVPGGR